ncbi:hypothetical protein [Methyloferula stellata]|uniref:hypothetical protein n=1 Tax=Methyloferula stellata TaxID=876270 RepID=UPI00126913D8|nr:hypothetical protein [Methyloferula stellata]
MPSKKRPSFSKRGAMAQPSYAVCLALNLRKFFHGNVRVSICPNGTLEWGRIDRQDVTVALHRHRRSASDVVIDSNNLERDTQIRLRNLRKLDCARKTAARFPHPALVFFGPSKPAVLAEDTCSHLIAGRMVQLNIDGSRHGPQGVMFEAGRDKDRKQHQNRRQNEIEKARHAAR